LNHPVERFDAEHQGPHVMVVVFAHGVGLESELPIGEKEMQRIAVRPER